MLCRVVIEPHFDYVLYEMASTYNWNELTDEIVSFYMVFLGIVFKTRLKYSKELLTIMLKVQKLTL